MREQKVFIKRYPSKGEFPKEDGVIVLTTNERLLYNQTFGWVTLQNYTTKAPDYWLEEIELPSEKKLKEEEKCVYEISNEKALPYNSLWKQGANFILNKLKGE